MLLGSGNAAGKTGNTPNNGYRDTSNPISTRLHTPRGDVLADATVQVFDCSNPDEEITRTQETTTNSNGRFIVAKQTPALALVKGEVHNETWFGVVPLAAVENNQKIEIQNLQVFGPSVSWGEETGLPYAVITVWATYDSNHPREAEIHIEITNAKTGGENPENVGTTNYDLSSGIFSLTFPEPSDTYVYYGAQRTSSRFGWVNSKVAHSPDDEEYGSDVYSEFHPMQNNSLDVPLYEVLFWNFLGITDDEAYSTNYSASEVAETTEEGMMKILGAMPGIGTALGMFQTISWGVDKIFGQRQTKLPEGVEMLSANPNQVDTASIGWNGNNDTGADDALSAVANFPVQFGSSQPVTFTAQAEWQKSAAIPTNDIHGIFRKTFDLAPLRDGTPLVGSMPPSDPDDDGLYEDVTGDGELTQDDITAFAENLNAPSVKSNAESFDFNGNGRIDYDDVVELAEEIE